MEKLEVLHVMRTYFGMFGGERQLKQLFSQQSNVANESFAFLYKDPSVKKEYQEIPWLKVLDIFPMAISPKRLLIECILFAFLYPFLLIRTFLLLLYKKYDIVFVHGFPTVLLFWLPAKFSKKQKFAYIHEGSKESKLGKSLIFDWIYSPYDMVGGASQDSMRSLQKLVPVAKLFAIENGVDLDKIIPKTSYEISLSEIQLVNTARLVHFKQHEFLIEALSLLNNENVHLSILGDGPRLEELSAIAEKFKVKEQVHFLGRVDNVPEILSISDIYVHSSYTEAVSLAVLEAMATGLPSIIVKGDGVSECHITDKTGFIVQRDPKMMAKKINLLIEHEENRKKLGAFAREHASENYSKETNRNKYDQIYKTLVELS